MKEIGVDPVAPDRRSPEYLATFVEAEIAKWAGPVKASGLATRNERGYFSGSAAAFSTGAQRAISAFT